MANLLPRCSDLAVALQDVPTLSTEKNTKRIILGVTIGMSGIVWVVLYGIRVSVRPIALRSASDGDNCNDKY